MPITLSETEARRLRMHAQGLDDRGTETTVAAAVRDCCGLQAQTPVRHHSVFVLVGRN